MDIALRPYRPEDFSRLLEIETLCFSEAHRFNEAELNDSLGNGFTVVAEADGVAVSFVVVRPNLQSATVYTIEVHPHFRRRGIATDLLGCVEACCREAGFTVMVLYVATNNPAVDLYCRLGYVVRVKHPNFYRDGADAFEMVKSLESGSAISRNSRT
jgi:ribosomal protein S18 acetylase RimI-like enzyme